ncbi:MAG: hypothetical protein HY735_34875 [Verrucomicrobia bacterium]|nr:hypothetical protein [Verrucomicrobiota bacterium]
MILTLSANPAYTVGSPNSATVTIADNDTAPPPPPPPTVTVTATDANAAEAGTEPGEFAVTRTGDTAAALTVNYALSGTASNGTDYQQLGTSVTIPAGAASATIRVTPIDDTAVEESETVILTLSADAAYTVGSPNSATVTIADNDTAPPPPPPPTVTVSATDANAAEAGAEPGEFTVSRTGSTTASLTANYSLSGTASNGTDYQQLGTSVTIPAGASSARITVRPIDDTAIEGNETVILTLSANPAYTVGSPNSATVTIADNDAAPLPTVTVRASDATAAEAGAEPGEFTISREGSTTASLTVRYTMSGTAASGSDYQALPGSAAIPAGASSVRIRVTPIDDAAVEPPETVVLTLQANAAYVIGGVGSAAVTIIDNDVGLPGLP